MLTLELLDRDENAKQIQEVLVEMGNGLQQSAETQIENLPLPTRDADINVHCNRAKKVALQGFVFT